MVNWNIIPLDMDNSDIKIASQRLVSQGLKDLEKRVHHLMDCL